MSHHPISFKYTLDKCIFVLHCIISDHQWPNLKDKSFKTAADNFDIAGFWKRLGNLPLNLYAPQNKQVVPNFARSVTTFLYTKNPDVAIIWSAQV